MKLFALAILSVLFVSGCTHTEIIECASDMNCFMEAAKTCSPAHVALSDTREYGDIAVPFGWESSIRGPEGNDCSMYVAVTSFTPPPEMVAYMPEDVITDLHSLEGSDMNCKIPQSDISGLTFGDLRYHFFNIFNEYCSGTHRVLSERIYQNLLEEMQQQISKSFSILPGYTYCDFGVIKIQLHNVGTETLYPEDFTIAVDGVNASGGLTQTIEPEGYGLFSWDCGGTCLEDRDHLITFETISVTSTVRVYC